ncbi:DUF7521 family protein [Halodesulfurarchaeum formicicum]|uniref:Uncharacterized protein n=1 Tax=Halodesulfurarchaeum formicicum TaxID=1873524 RepID=A0A1J1AAB4_9EURY|nr:hypothetical protein [Halodesulfurarchaeum formicicum]APE94715.1 hypothetical protein HSR6_0247 [Halodesulfurarchaeum formicicum]
MNPSLVSNVTTVLLALVGIIGFFVSLQSYRAYQRYGSKQMGLLALGIAMLTVVPVGLTVGLPVVPGVTDAASLLVVSISYLVGLAAIDVAFNHVE